jgi:hypothetical protein
VAVVCCFRSYHAMKRQRSSLCTREAAQRGQLSGANMVWKARYEDMVGWSTLKLE